MCVTDINLLKEMNKSKIKKKRKETLKQTLQKQKNKKKIFSKKKHKIKKSFKKKHSKFLADKMGNTQKSSTNTSSMVPAGNS